MLYLVAFTLDFATYQTNYSDAHLTIGSIGGVDIVRAIIENGVHRSAIASKRRNRRPLTDGICG